jgi:hypothetical protein
VDTCCGFLKDALTALFAKKKQPGWLALSDAADGVAVHLVPGAERPCLLRLERWTGLAELSERRRQLQLERYRCATLLPRDSYRFLLAELADVPATELA